MSKIANWDARPFIADRAPFESHTGSFRGVLRDGYGSLPGTGYLPRVWHDTLYGGHSPRDDRATYVVMSYGTPIAFYADGEWHMPPIKYSVTTTRHQIIVRAALVGERVQTVPVTA